MDPEGISQIQTAIFETENINCQQDGLREASIHENSNKFAYTQHSDLNEPDRFF